MKINYINIITLISIIQQLIKSNWITLKPDKTARKPKTKFEKPSQRKLKDHWRRNSKKLKIVE